MKKTALSFLASFFILTTPVMGQDEFSGYVIPDFPDTIKVGKEIFRTVNSLDSIAGVIIDTLEKPHGYIFRTVVSSRDAALYFARAAEDHYLVYQLGSWSAFSDFKFERVDFNGSGSKELVMFNKQVKQHSPGDSEASVDEWLSIWDLDSVEMLALFQNYVSRRIYDNDRAINTTCFNLIPSISKKKIQFSQSGNCNKCKEDISMAVKNPIKITYQLTADGLIKTSESGGIYYRSDFGILVPNVSGNYKRYTDQTNRFSFQIPTEWDIQKDDTGELDDQAVMNVMDSTLLEYFENGFFKIAIHGPGVCDSAFMAHEGFSVSDSSFFTYDFDYFASGNQEDINYAEPIKGTGWIGYSYTSVCGRLLNDRRDFDGDICESIYFYDGKHSIIEIYTIGKEINEKARKRLIQSFEFY